MSFTLTPVAEASAVVDYYDGIHAGLGEDFREELVRALSRVRSNPRMYARESGEIRICPLHRFPYSVFYEEVSERIWIAAVGHHRRRPGYWAQRRSE